MGSSLFADQLAVRVRQGDVPSWMDRWLLPGSLLRLLRLLLLLLLLLNMLLKLLELLLRNFVDLLLLLLLLDGKSYSSN
jgi:hypothetical protein